MYRFILTLILFLFILQVPLMVESFLPKKALSYRPGESLTKRYTALYGSYFSNQIIEMDEVGNLAMRTEFEVKKRTITFTDEYGFRNKTFFNNPDMILIGDSQIVCASVTQEDILSEQLMKVTNLKIANIAVGSPKTYARMQQLNLFKKPKFIVFEKAERELPEYTFDGYAGNKKIEKLKFNLQSNKFSNYFLDWISKYSRNYAKLLLKSKTFSKNIFPNSIKDPALFFYDGKTSDVTISTKELNSLVQEIVKTKNYFEQQGIKFAFLPFPNKETIYWDHIPFKTQPSFLATLIKELKNNNVYVINSLAALNEEKNKSTNYLYQTDDTHWNKLGISITAKEIIKFINTK